MRRLVMVTAAIAAACVTAWGAENILVNGGFEQAKAQPDKAGTVFDHWANWKWNGDCRIAVDNSIKHEKVEGGKAGLVMGEPEPFTPYQGVDAVKCPYCGMTLDPKQPACGVCGEPTAGIQDYARLVTQLQSLNELADLVRQAKAEGINTLYAEIPLAVGKKFVDEGWRKENDPAKRADWTAFLVRQINYEKRTLQAALHGKPDPRVLPSVPDYHKLVKKGGYFYVDDKPVLLVTQGNSGGERADARYLASGRIYGIISAVGASRYNYDRTPIWPLYQKDPKSHRVFDGGWCGHIIRDKWSIGGANAGPCIISLDYPPMREAVRQAIVNECHSYKRERDRPQRIISMDWEFTYQNYDESSLKEWQKWLQDRYGTMAKLNGIWKTHLKSFDEVTLPPVAWYAETNPAKFYDFGEFNLWRFTDYLLWARQVIEKEVPGYPFTVGGGQPFGSNFAKEGIDEEQLRTMGVINVFLSETGSRSWGTPVAMDLVHSMDPKAMIHDPEYHAMGGFMPLMFFHGASTIDFYDVGKSGVNSTLPNGYATLRGCLDARRLASYIIQFPKASPQVAMLYSRGSMIQRYPGRTGRRGVDTPYTLEIKKCYRAGTQLDTPMGFETTRQAKQGVRGDLKVLVLPSAYYVNAQAWHAITTFVNKGGTVLMTPTSAVADEYDRRRDYLKGLGVKITKQTVPTYLAKEGRAGVAMPGSEYDFIQGPIAETAVSESPTATLHWTAPGKGPAKTLAGDGIRQRVKLSGQPEILAAFDDGTPALFAVEVGKGEFIYLAMQLQEDDMGRLLDWVYDRAGVRRKIRVVNSSGKRIAGVESRTVTVDQGLLTYIYNMNDTSVKAVLRPAAGVKLNSIDDLTYARTLKPDHVFDLGPYDWVVLQLN